MPGLLDGQIADAIFKGFKGKLLKGTLKRVAPDEGAGLDQLGDPQGITETTWNCEGFVDNSSRGRKTQDGVPDHTVKICIFAKSLPAGVRPELDDLVQFPRTSGPWYQLQTPAETDPATALWEARASLVQGDIDTVRARAP